MTYYTLSGYADAGIVSGSGTNTTTASLLSNDYTDPASKSGSTSGLAAFGVGLILMPAAAASLAHPMRLT